MENLPDNIFTQNQLDNRPEGSELNTDELSPQDKQNHLQEEINELKSGWQKINEEIKNLTNEDISDFKNVFREKMIKLNLPPETDLQDLLAIKNEYYQKIQIKEEELKKLKEKI